MTTRKQDLALPPRTPSWVSREVGAAELCISPETWDAMVAKGELPKPDIRLLERLPRWEWEAVKAHLKGTKTESKLPRDLYVVAAENSHGQTTRKRHA